jgi:transcriptional regulator
MYIPTHFEESRLHELHEFMRRHPFASIVAQAAGYLDANHVPLILDPGHGPCGRLRGHVARANSMWQDIEAGAAVLVIFHGPHGYISPNFYPAKQEHGMVVPTWNYAVVHARGRIAWLHDRQWLRALVTELTERHEAEQAEPWRVSDAPEAYIEKMIKGIVGLEISIDALQGKMKFSQNRAEADRVGVRRGLSLRSDAGSIELAELMSDKGNESAS